MQARIQDKRKIQMIELTEIPSADQVPRSAGCLAAATDAGAALDDVLGADDVAADNDLNDLVLELKECKTVEDVLEVATDEAANMSPEEVSFALYRVAYMARSLSNQGTQRYLARQCLI